MTRFSFSGAEQAGNEQVDKMNRVIQAALEAADPRAAVRRALKLDGNALETSAGQQFELDRFTRIRVIGAGKASQAMTRGLLDVLGERVTEGLIITKHVEEKDPLPANIRVLRGGHPVPTAESLNCARALAEFLQYGDASAAGAGPERSGGSASSVGAVPARSGGSAIAPGAGPERSGDSRQDDLLFCLISGGGSALMTLPVEGLGLEDLQEMTRLLLACGADIGEINTLRKHLDQVKGGGLARLASGRSGPGETQHAASRTSLVTLILSDVIGSPLDVIASGPTVADPTTYADALAILRKYRIEDRLPGKIRAVLERGERGELAETVKPGDPLLERVSNQVVTSNLQAAEAALAQAAQEGFNTLLLTTYLQGEASQAGTVLASLLRQSAATGQPAARPACLVAGGETTVTLRGQGLGGRNQELALGAAFLLAGVQDVALVTLGTDGEDGPTDAAGAVITGETIRRAKEMSLDPLAFLQNNDSYHFFSALGDLLITGPTGTNVNDLAFLFAF